MKKVLSLFLILLLVSLFCASCGGSEKTPFKPSDPSHAETVDDTDPTDPTNPTEPTDTVSKCGNNELDEGEVCDSNAMECNIIDPIYTGGYAICKTDCSGWDLSGCQGTPTDPTDPTNPTDPTDPTNPGTTDSVFALGSYFVNIVDVTSGTDGATRDFRIYEPTGAEGNIPVIHFLHGFTYKDYYYDDILTHLASHGFIVVSSQSDHAMMGGDTTIVEAEKVVTFLKSITNLLDKECRSWHMCRNTNLLVLCGSRFHYFTLHLYFLNIFK